LHESSQTETTEDTGSDTTVSDLDLLKEKVGGVTNLHYEGTVSGDNIIQDNNKVTLDFDLGTGEVSGNVKFTKEYDTGFMSNQSDWDTDVQGSFEQNNRFNLEAVSDGYSGSGSVDLVGEHLEQAQGSMSLTKEGFMLNETVDVDFTANKTN
jgi:hypothetical protein